MKYIILDTNIWIYSTRLLDDSMSAALLFYLNNTGGKLVLPEIIEKEVSANLTKIAKSACGEIDKQYALLQKIFGSIDDYRLPNDGDINQAFTKKQTELKKLIQKVPFTFLHAKGALNRILKGIPPNKVSNQKQQGDQQFKDSCIWEVAIELAKKSEVVFITKDYGFFENRKPKNGLATPLKNEVAKLNHNISVFPDIHSFLTDIKDTIPKLNVAVIKKSLNEQINKDKSLIDAVGSEQTELLSDFSCKAFLTEKNNLVAIHYGLRYLVDNIDDIFTGEPLGGGIMVVGGNCLFDFTEGIVTKNSVDSISFEDPKGLSIPGKGATHFARMSATIGRGIKTYELRAEMPDEML
ncbi:PIN domain-containing protein [Desulfogranum marinum]|uniref:PIN domain-containing protein n=1 Tax=Desulfogranum marinum TaxID=453220 RepID=UPI0022B723F1|nr:PIN domain-containing protein [Desulfogranum marinum]